MLEQLIIPGRRKYMDNLYVIASPEDRKVACRYFSRILLFYLFGPDVFLSTSTESLSHLFLFIQVASEMLAFQHFTNFNWEFLH